MYVSLLLPSSKDVLRGSKTPDTYVAYCYSGKSSHHIDERSSTTDD